MTARRSPTDQSDGGGEENGRPASVAQKGETILIAADHAGFEEKEVLKRELTKLGLNPEDLGASDCISDDDYPDYAHPLARKISRGEAKRGILLCGSGIGVDIVANRYPQVRAALSWMPEIAELSRRHNDSNVLVIPSRFVSMDQAVELMKRWLGTPFEGGRHTRRVEKIDDLADALDRVIKIVGVSDDHELLRRLEERAKEIIGARATIARSQPYYLDITHPSANKGTVVETLSRLPLAGCLPGCLSTIWISSNLAPLGGAVPSAVKRQEELQRDPCAPARTLESEADRT